VLLNKIILKNIRKSSIKFSQKLYIYIYIYIMVKKIDISNITIDDLYISQDDIHVITVAKVGTCNFSHALEKKCHTHAIAYLEEFLIEDKKKLIISGIRNPLDRNISYLFATFGMQSSEPILKYKGNFQEIQNTFVCNDDEINDIEINNLIEIFKNKDYFYHNHFTVWFEEFFKTTKINTINFDKEKGLQLYELDNNTYILFYVLEKFTDNKNIFEKFLKISMCDSTNQTILKNVSNKYKVFKEKITFDASYKESLLNTSVMKYFYSEEFLNNFNSKY
jgi:hypothetical protein